MADPIRVEGLREFQRGLKALSKDAPKGLRVALNAVAETIAADARSKVPRRTGRARASIKPASTQTAVRIRAGGNRAPWYPWLDFGGRVGRDRSVRRPFLKEGRYLYRSYFDLKTSGKVQEALERALVDVARRSGLEVD